ncbi:MAG: class I SAM-dependent methyltransferase [Chloroflexota bacterium]
MLTLEKQNQLRDRYRLDRPGWRPATEQFAGLVGHYLKSSHSLLDLGCGRGGLIEQLDHPHSLAIGLDPDMHSLREHRLKMNRAAGYSHELPFPNEHFDLIYCSWLLEHLQSPQADFAEIGRVLKPDGRFLFVTPNVDSPVAVLNRLLGRLKPVQNLLIKRLYGRESDDAFPTHYRANSEAEILSLLNEINQNKVGLGSLRLEALYFVEDPTYLAFLPSFYPFLKAFEKRLPHSRRVHLVGVITKQDL